MSKVYAESNFLIYVCWDTTTPTGGVVSGSLLLDSALTTEEAAEKVEKYRERSYASYKDSNTVSRFTYINNRREWWPHESMQSASQTAQ